MPKPVIVEKQLLTTPRVEDALERLFQLCDGSRSPLISLKNRLNILERVFNQTDQTNPDFAVLALVEDIQEDRIAIEEAVTAVTMALEGTPTSGGAR